MNQNQDSLKTDELFEKVQRKAGVLAIEKITSEHISLITEIQKKYELTSNLDLLSTSSDESVPKQTRRKIRETHGMFKRVIDMVSKAIENKKYLSTEEAIEQGIISKSQKNKALSLVVADKEFHISCQTLKISAEIFAQLNERIIERLEEAEQSKDMKKARELALGNAILVYEIADFLINFIETFTLDGVNQITNIHAEMMTHVKQLKANETSRKREANKIEINPEHKQEVVKQIEFRLNSLHEIEQEWGDYIASVKDLQDDVNIISHKLPTLHLIKSNAQGQIDLLEVAALTHVLKNDLIAINSAVLTVENMKLISLSPEKLRRLGYVG